MGETQQNIIGRDEPPGTALTPTQIQAISFLATGATITETAIALGVARSTLYRWIEEPAFAAEIDRLKVCQLEHVRRLLGEAVDGAVACLTELMRDDSVDPNLRLRIALLVLGNVDPETAREIADRYVRFRHQLE